MVRDPARFSRRHLLFILAAALPAARADAQNKAAPGSAVPKLSFDGQEYLFRWSKDGQHEFTPAPEPDLKTWRNMLTVNIHRQARDGEGLARTANAVLGRYRQHGRVIKTASKPARPDSPAEHLIVAAFSQPGFVEMAFTRIVLHRATGIVLTYSHRIYDAKAGPAMADWLNAHGNRVEAALVTWKELAKLEPLLG